MEFMTTKEAVKKWNITKASVIVSKSYSHSSDEIILTNPEEWQD